LIFRNLGYRGYCYWGLDDVYRWSSGDFFATRQEAV